MEDKKVKLKRIFFEFLIIVIVIGICTILALIKTHIENSVPPFEERIISYEVVSVYKYVKVSNSTKICYNFSYLDGETLKHVDEFVHHNGGPTSVTIGEKDLYIVDDYTKERYLQLTKETLKLLTGTSE